MAGSCVKKLSKGENLCCHCGETSVSLDTELKKTYKTVHPICDGKGKNSYKSTMEQCCSDKSSEKGRKKNQ